MYYEKTTVVKSRFGAWIKTRRGGKGWLVCTCKNHRKKQELMANWLHESLTHLTVEFCHQAANLSNQISLNSIEGREVEYTHHEMMLFKRDDPSPLFVLTSFNRYLDLIKRSRHSKSKRVPFSNASSFISSPLPKNTGSQWIMNDSVCEPGFLAIPNWYWVLWNLQVYFPPHPPWFIVEAGDFPFAALEKSYPHGSTNGKRPWKSMDWKMKSPFGARLIFRDKRLCYVKVSGSVPPHKRLPFFWHPKFYKIKMSNSFHLRVGFYPPTSFNQTFGTLQKVL